MTKPRILVVEDDEDLLLSLAIRLQASGFEVATATDAIAAVAVYARTAPDLVLLDLGLPGGGGLVVIRRIRRICQGGGRDIPIVVLTAHRASDVRDQVRTLGASAVYQKPVDSAELLGTIHQALSDRAVETPPPSKPCLEVPQSLELLDHFGVEFGRVSLAES